jgi:hypothetical protein
MFGLFGLIVASADKRPMEWEELKLGLSVIDNISGCNNLVKAPFSRPAVQKQSECIEHV